VDIPIAVIGQDANEKTLFPEDFRSTGGVEIKAKPQGSVKKYENTGFRKPYFDRKRRGRRYKSRRPVETEVLTYFYKPIGV